MLAITQYYSLMDFYRNVSTVVQSFLMVVSWCCYTGNSSWSREVRGNGALKTKVFLPPNLKHLIQEHNSPYNTE